MTSQLLRVRYIRFGASLNFIPPPEMSMIQDIDFNHTNFHDMLNARSA